MAIRKIVKLGEDEVLRKRARKVVRRYKIDAENVVKPEGGLVARNAVCARV